MVRQSKDQDFKAWFEAVEVSQIAELRCFTRGLLRDKEVLWLP